MQDRQYSVLFVDDDIDDREFFIDALSYVDPAISCRLAKDCSDALRILKESPVLPTHVFLDIHMPNISGKDCLTALKEDLRHKDIKVVMYSNNSNEKEMAEYKDAGATYFLVKPPTFKGLCDSLSVLFGK